MSIRLNPENSKVIGDKVFITTMKAHNLKETLSSYLNWGSKINHPLLGTLVEYNGPYTRKVK
jgi:hypothetical protein